MTPRSATGADQVPSVGDHDTGGVERFGGDHERNSKQLCEVAARVRSSADAPAPLFVVECNNREADVAASDLRKIVDKFHNKGPRECQLLFVMARAFCNTAQLEKEVRKFGMNLLVLRRFPEKIAKTANIAAGTETGQVGKPKTGASSKTNSTKKLKAPLQSPRAQPRLTSSTLLVESFVSGFGARTVVLFELGEDL